MKILAEKEAVIIDILENVICVQIKRYKCTFAKRYFPENSFIGMSFLYQICQNENISKSDSLPEEVFDRFIEIKKQTPNIISEKIDRYLSMF